MTKEKAPTRKQRLNLDTDRSDYTNISTELKANQRDWRTLVKLARKWASRGYYPSPSKAMQALLEGNESWN